MKQEDWTELNEKSHYKSLKKQDIANRKLIKKLQLEKEELKKQLALYGVASSADYKHINKLMDELNTIMWESYMVKGKDFGRQEGYKIMGLLEQWAEHH